VQERERRERKRLCARDELMPLPSKVFQADFQKELVLVTVAAQLLTARLVGVRRMSKSTAVFNFEQRMWQWQETNKTRKTYKHTHTHTHTHTHIYIYT